MTLRDNGNGTAALPGTPPAGTTGTFTPTIFPLALGSFGNGVDFPVKVVSTAQLTSANSANFFVSAVTPSTFSLTSNVGTIFPNGPLPAGLTFTGGNPATISGIPAAGTGGQYQLNLSLNGGVAGVTTTAFTLNVFEAPKFNSPRLATLFVGTPASLAVTTTGFPSSSTRPLAAGTGAPVSALTGNGMYFGVQGLFASFRASNLSPERYATGTLTLAGTPQATEVGTRQLQITSDNGNGTPALQNLTLQVYPAPTLAGINLLTNYVVSRDTANNVIVTVVVANTGRTAAQNVTLLTARLDGIGVDCVG